MIVVEDAMAALDSGWTLIQERYEQLGGDIERPILSPAMAFWTPEELRTGISHFSKLMLTSRKVETTDERHFNAGTAYPLSSVDAEQQDPISKWLKSETDFKTLLVSSSPGRREILSELLNGRGLTPFPINNWQDFLQTEQALCLAVGSFETGMILPDRSLRLITAEQLGLDRPRQHNRRRRRSRDPDAIVRELTDLRVSAPVVHEEYGIGRYRGLVNLVVDGVLTEFLLLEYADSDKLYVPVHSLHLVTRYTGASPEQAPLHRLGSDQWLKARRKAVKQARDVAVELLTLYAQRAARQRGGGLCQGQPQGAHGHGLRRPAQGRR